MTRTGKNEYFLAWARKNRIRINGYRRATQQVLRAIVAEAKAKGCLHCPEKDPVCLDFHHRDPKTKKFSVANFAHVGVVKLKAEIAKCDLMCANCHRKLHWGR